MVSWREDSQPKLTVRTTPVLMLFLQHYASKKWFLFRFGRFTILQWVVAAIFYYRGPIIYLRHTVSTEIIDLHCYQEHNEILSSLILP